MISYAKLNVLDKISAFDFFLFPRLSLNFEDRALLLIVNSSLSS